MPFVHLKYFRLKPKSVEDVHAADPQNHFLTHSHLEIATVKFRRNETVLAIILRYVGVEQVKTDAAHQQLPNFGINVAI